jgi:Fur family peroxide stress response transcriptional regulator
MESIPERVFDKLAEKNIKPSFHRIKVLEYLMVNKNHPTVEQIYSSLKKLFPTLSKATIYNSLNLFVEKGLVQPITIEETEIRYDSTVESHGHFKCECCGKIYDFGIDIDSIPSSGLDNFIIYSKEIYYRGICRNCADVKSSQRS